jgi:TPR repeat protein
MAAKWYEVAAQNDNQWAQISLGQWYRTGDGVPKDLKKAYFWLSLE